MDYIIDFDLVSIAYLSITAFFYQRQPKVPSIRNTLFGVLLFLGVFFAVMDVVVVVMEPQAWRLPRALVWITQAVAMFSIQLALALFFSYCLALTGRIKNMPRRNILISLIPFGLIVLLTLLPLGVNDIFYLDDQNVYHRGTLYVAIYINAALYLIASLVTVLLRAKQLRRQKLICIFSFLATSFIAMLIQFNYPPLLLNATANALALTLIYHILEAPSTHIDALTGVLNRVALPLIISESYEQNRRSTLLLFSLNSLRLVQYSLGMKVWDKLLAEFAAYLRGAFPTGYIFRISTEVFAVLLSGGSYWGKEQLQRCYESIPEYFSAGRARVQAAASLAAINSEDAADRDSMLELEEYILQLQREQRLAPLLLADAQFQRQLQQEEQFEQLVETAIEQGDIQVYYQPIHNAQGRLTALEALARISDGSGGFLPTQEAVEMAERNGNIHRLGQLIMEQVCQFLSAERAWEWGLHHIGVNLSALQLAREDLCETMSAIMDSYGLEHSLISFEITETAPAAVADIAATMKCMNRSGFSFIMDDFGKGYANFNNISQLPLICVKIDKALLWEAGESREKLAFLQGIAAMVQTLGLTSVCEGVETLEQAELLTELGVDMQQGYLYSCPLPPWQLLAYIERMVGHGL